MSVCSGRIHEHGNWSMLCQAADKLTNKRTRSQIGCVSTRLSTTCDRGAPGWLTPDFISQVGKSLPLN
eukprot:2466650-Amphidinium_carterae.1